VRRTAAALAACTLALAQSARAESGVLALSPGATKIGFTLAATLHTVRGSLQLLRGELHFDAESGSASGEIAIDARSAKTGNGTRDATMHEDVLESERYPEIVFTAEHLQLKRSAADRGEAVLSGRVRLHGDEHKLEIPAHLERDGDAVRIDARFRIPYVEWGLRDVSNLLLHVGPEVEVRVEAKTRYEPAR
jgi:polyisoprenoid-binding protein YceI